MPYFIVKRKVVTIEDVIVQAETKQGAFNKAGLNHKCKVFSKETGEYNPDFGSVMEIAYISEATRLEIEE